MRITYMPVVRELAARGHQVTVVTPYDSKEPDNVNMVIIQSPFEEILNEVTAHSKAEPDICFWAWAISRNYISYI